MNMETEDPDALPEMPRPGGRGHAFEAAASMLWTLTFLAYSSSTLLSEFGTGPGSWWTVLLVTVPVVLAGLQGVLENGADGRLALGKYIAYIVAPAALQLLRPDRIKPENAVAGPAFDLLTFAVLWLPVDLGLLPVLGPTGKVSIWASLTRSLSAINTFLVLRPFPEPGRSLGYSFKFDPMHILLAVISAIGFCVVAMPLVIAIGYGRFHRARGLRFKSQAAVFMSLYFAALSEEILFRGIALNLIERAMQDLDGLAPVIFASVLYAFGNLKSKAQGLPIPNWRAAVITLFSGILCGLIWRSTGMVTVSAITHACVHYIYRTLFYKHNRD